MQEVDVSMVTSESQIVHCKNIDSFPGPCPPASSEKLSGGPKNEASKKTEWQY